MPQETRMERVMSGLTALERAKLVLASFKTCLREDPLVRARMPMRQSVAFNRHIYTMHAANMHIAHCTHLLDSDLDRQWSRVVHLRALCEWSLNLQEIEEAIADAARGMREGERAAQTLLTALRLLLEHTPGQRR